MAADRKVILVTGALMQEVPDRLGALIPDDADAGEVATAIADRIRVDVFRRAGLDDPLTPGSAR